MSIADDINAIANTATLGPVVAFGALSRRALTFRVEDVPELDRAGGYVLTSTHVLTLTGQMLAEFGFAEENDISIDGTTFRVRQIRRAGPTGLLRKVIVV